MFTGLVQDVATIREIVKRDESSVLSFETNLAKEMKVGDSISINGVCLTAISIAGPLINVDVMIQTLKLSNLGALKSGERVNAELATRADTRLGGHIVQGHVDGVGTVVTNEVGEKWQKFVIEIPAHLKKYVVNQGSICVDGVSLTVGAIDDEASQVTLWLIPETLEKTTLGLKHIGSRVNIEVDVLAKYVERLISQRDIPNHGINNGKNNENGNDHD
jgi:riboflavin synthase